MRRMDKLEDPSDGYVSSLVALWVKQEAGFNKEEVRVDWLKKRGKHKNIIIKHKNSMICWKIIIIVTKQKKL